RIVQVAAYKVDTKHAGVFIGPQPIDDPRDEPRRLLGVGAAGRRQEAVPERGEQDLPPEPPSGNPRPPPVLANPAETSPSGSRYLYKYVYDGSHLRVKLFFSGVPGWPPP